MGKCWSTYVGLYHTSRRDTENVDVNLVQKSFVFHMYNKEDFFTMHSRLIVLITGAYCIKYRGTQKSLCYSAPFFIFFLYSQW